MSKTLRGLAKWIEWSMKLTKRIHERGGSGEENLRGSPRMKCDRWVGEV